MKIAYWLKLFQGTFLSKCLLLNFMEGSIGANFKTLCIAFAPFEISLTDQNLQTECSVMVRIIGMCDYW